ncbi:MAG: type II secretion system F family protein [Planctomycetota bacterium]
MLLYITLGLVVLCVTGLIFGAAMLLTSGNEAVEDRLSSMTKNGGRGISKDQAATTSVLKEPLAEQTPNAIEQFVGRFLNLPAFIEQSGIEGLTVSKFVAMSFGLGIVFSIVYFIASPIKALTPFLFGTGMMIPFAYVWWMRRKRLGKFGAQLPEAMDLISQALRAGQSLPAGIQLVSTQMAEPIASEFARAYEQQNLGVSLTDALKEMTGRIPNLDLQFFSTAVILQRQTGGDLAEILDKISKLCRERFQIHGQIQALTGEGRLSGAVLLGLPPVLFLVMLRLNYDYVMMLFNDPLGQKMLIFGIVMQIFGAIWIKKVITIKV